MCNKDYSLSLWKAQRRMVYLEGRWCTTNTAGLLIHVFKWHGQVVQHESLSTARCHNTKEGPNVEKPVWKEVEKLFAERRIERPNVEKPVGKKVEKPVAERRLFLIFVTHCKQCTLLDFFNVSGIVKSILAQVAMCAASKVPPHENVPFLQPQQHVKAEGTQILSTHIVLPAQTL
jgi:hypothetical protein